MLENKILENYCLLVLKKGVNLQKNQGLMIICPIEQKEIAVTMTETAYKLGAKKVEVRWQEERIDRLSYQYASTETLCDIPKWFVDSRNYLVKEGYCYVAIDGDDPEAFSGIDAVKLATVAQTRSKRLKKFSDAVMENRIRWCVVSVPTEKWAKKVFPNSSNPLTDLSSAIERTMRLDTLNPVEQWDNHVNTLERRAEFLNNSNFKYLKYSSSNGTDFKVGLARNHVWLSAKEKAKDGVDFIANMPTEEVFTAPDLNVAEGRIVSAMPLCYNGQIIDGFSLEFENGKVKDFTAKIGYETLKGLLQTDKGAKRLGEVAIIGKNSPVAKENTLFYNTLFDENASCHFALGKAYPTTVKGVWTEKELREMGINDSVIHVDFMVGTYDMKIVGVKENGEEIIIFDDGDWII
jgi:aminopeptidase